MSVYHLPSRTSIRYRLKSPSAVCPRGLTSPCNITLFFYLLFFGAISCDRAPGALGKLSKILFYFIWVDLGVSGYSRFDFKNHSPQCPRALLCFADGMTYMLDLFPPLILVPSAGRWFEQTISSGWIEYRGTTDAVLG